MRRKKIASILISNLLALTILPLSAFASTITTLNMTDTLPSVQTDAYTVQGYWSKDAYTYKITSSGKEGTVTAVSDAPGYVTADELSETLDVLSAGKYASTFTNSSRTYYDTSGNQITSIDYTINYAKTIYLSLPYTNGLSNTIDKKVIVSGSNDAMDYTDNSSDIIIKADDLIIGASSLGYNYKYNLALTFSGGLEITGGAKVTLSSGFNSSSYGDVTYTFGDNVKVSGNSTLEIAGNESIGTDVTFSNGKSLIIESGSTANLGYVRMSGGSESAALIQNAGTLQVITTVSGDIPTFTSAGTVISNNGSAELVLGTYTTTSTTSSVIDVTGGTLELTAKSEYSSSQYANAAPSIKTPDNSTVSAITVASGASVELTEYFTSNENAVVSTTSSDSDAISLSTGATVTIDGVSYTVSSTVDEGASNYVDNDGKLHLTSGATVTVSEDADEDVNIYDYLALDDDAYAASSTEDGVDYVITTVSETLKDAAGDGVTVTTAPNETSTTDNTAASPEPTTTTEPIITGGDVTAAYAEQAAEEIASIVETESSVSSITTKRIDTVIDYGYDETTGKYTTDVEPLIQYTITYSDGSDDKTYTEELDLSGSEADVTFTVPDDAKTAWSGSFASVQAAHTYGGSVEYLYPTSTTDTTLTYTTTKGFSEWEMGLLSASSDNSAQTVNVTYSEYTDNGDAVPGKYYINVTGDKDIYRFMAAQLMFDLETSDAISYTIEPVTDNGVSMTTSSAADGTVYEFNMDTTSAASQTVTSGTAFAIGIVTFTGVGVVDSFGVDSSYSDNMVQAAVKDSADNNIVKTYTVGGSTSTATSGNLNISAQLTDVPLSLDTVDLTINVVFPNSVDEQIADYTDMQINLSNVLGDDTINLGSGVSNVSYGEVTIDGVNYNAYIATATVPKAYATKLEFVGAGYRTYRTSITPTDDAAVTVWNNAMDSDETVVIDESYDAMGGVKDDVTFLAGDIVMDNSINIWDLSAAVSYFGKSTDTTAVDEYAKYDLNRDGKIDSRDIAMVLVSWNK